MTDITILHARWLITCEDRNQVLENHALVIQNGLIQAILPSDAAKQKFPAAKHELYNHHVLMPGMINSHTHSSMGYFRGLADDLALMDWLNNYIWPAEKKWISNDFVYDASMFAMAEMIRNGVTCFNDMYFFLEATAKAAQTAGLRAHIGMTVIDFPTPWAKSFEEYIEKGLAFYEQYKNNALIKATLAPHAPYTVCDEHLIRIKELADQLHLKINIHLQEAPDEITKSMAEFNMRPLQRLQKIGFLSENVIAIHMTQVIEEDWQILKKYKPQIVHCPQSNMKLASGGCPVTKLQSIGLNVALGTDGAASNNDLNMLGEMRTAAFLAKHITQDPTALSAEETLKLATLNGAKALGIDKVTGSLTVGKSADVIAIDLEQIETQPVYHPVSQIVYAASRQQITDVWVAGKQLLKQRKLLTLDEQEILAKAKAWQEKIAAVQLKQSA